MAELADALDSKSSDRKIVWVRAPPPAIFLEHCALDLAYSTFDDTQFFRFHLACLVHACEIFASMFTKSLQTVRTDANGRYISDGLAAGVYRVTLVVNGAVKASINNAKTKADQPTQLNFDLKLAPAPQANAAAKTGKHKVWVPATTGSHIGGTWVEVDDSGSSAAGAENVQQINSQQLQRQIHSTTGPAPTP